MPDVQEAPGAAWHQEIWPEHRPDEQNGGHCHLDRDQSIIHGDDSRLILGRQARCRRILVIAANAPEPYVNSLIVHTPQDSMLRHTPAMNQEPREHGPH